MDTKDLERAKQWFQLSYAEAQKHTSRDVRGELTVRTLHALALTAWQAKDYPEAMEWMQKAEAEQVRFGKTWVPEMRQHRKKLEELMQRSSQPPVGTPG
jgi:hypothetical protein